MLLATIEIGEVGAVAVERRTPARRHSFVLSEVHRSRRGPETRGTDIRDLKIEIVSRNDIGAIVAIVTTDGVVDVDTASAEINSGRARYFAGPDSYVRVPVKAFCDAGGPYLYANWDGSRRNQLHDLAVAERRALRAAAGRRSTAAGSALPVRLTRPAPAAPSARPAVTARPKRSRWSTLMRVLGLD